MNQESGEPHSGYKHIKWVSEFIIFFPEQLTKNTHTNIAHFKGLKHTQKEPYHYTTKNNLVFIWDSPDISDY